MSDARAKTTATNAPATEARGPVLEMLRALLAEGNNEQVIRLVAQILSRNAELEKRLAKRRLPSEGGNESEGVGSEQLELLLHALKEEANAALQEANEKLKQASKAPEKPEKPAKPPKQPALRRPPPPNLRRVPNPIAVPDAERACPTCGKAASARATTSRKSSS